MVGEPHQGEGQKERLYPELASFPFAYWESAQV